MAVAAHLGRPSRDLQNQRWENWKQAQQQEGRYPASRATATTTATLQTGILNRDSKLEPPSANTSNNLNLIAPSSSSQ
ncbi:uncharacterized protein BP5553_10559 [Venustampulla echinocandica]|uniref:Uncharacterized protein n=1 Tax=Venustampulla echinocandica TaxID=2656787 RepID=A0A370T8W5_9HELO|nr:uncharacterized protein BP5553_10559 [Venustampulla echinocandica]RDL29932.1 hypothetical protein BP5553_10559 [Venustampulla echinocandica]